MASIANQLKAQKRQSQPIRPIRTHFFEPLERRLLLSADWTGQAPLTSLAAPSADQAAVVILDQPQARADRAASDAVAGITSLEVTPLATTIYWDGGGDGTSWQDPLNWSGNVVPGATNDVIINLAGSNPIIRFTAAAGARTVRSIRCSEAFVESGGSLTVTGGASQFTANFSLTGGTLTATGIGTTLTTATVAGPIITMTGGKVTTTAGAIITFPTVTSLKDVSLNASGGGQIRFPAATSYVDTGFGQTIQSSGAGSRIDLSRLQTFDGGDSSATLLNAVSGGTVVLAGKFSASTSWTLSGLGSSFDVTRITGLAGATLKVSDGRTLSFPAVPLLTDVSLTALSGGQISFPVATSYVDNGFGQTIQASGTNSRIDLSHLLTFRGGVSSATQVNALSRGTVLLAGTISASTTLTASGLGSTINGVGVTRLTDVNLSASGGGQILFAVATSYVDTGFGQTIQATGTGSRIDLGRLTTFDGGDSSATIINALSGGSIVLAGKFSASTSWTLSGSGSSFGVAGVTALTGATLKVSDGRTLSFSSPSLTSLTNVSLNALSGGKISFPSTMTSYVDTGFGQTIQASGVGSRIDLSRLVTFDGGDSSATQVTALNWGTIVLAGKISPLTTLTASGVGSMIDGTRVTTLTDVNLTASGGGVLLLAATNYADTGFGQTIQASGAGSRIDLGRLTTLKGGVSSATQVGGLNGGVIVLSGQVSGQVVFTGTIRRGPSAPEVSVFGNLIPIGDGDTTPSTTDGTNFGSVALGRTPISRAFTVRNDSLVTLTLGTVTVPAGFTLTDGLVVSLAPGASDTFTVRLNTAVAGTKSGDIRFSNNDANGGDGVENPFNFRITGIVTV